MKLWKVRERSHGDRVSPPPVLVPGALGDRAPALQTLEHLGLVRPVLGAGLLGGVDRSLSVAPVAPAHRRPPTAADTNAPMPASANAAAAWPALRHISLASRVGTTGSGGSP